MRNLLRRIKAALKLGSIWGIAGGAVGAVIGGLGGLFAGSALGMALLFGAGAAAAGFILGVGFGGMLSVMEGHRTLDDLTHRRAALWGFAVGAGLPLVAGVAGLITGGPGMSLGVHLSALIAGAVSYGALTAGLASVTLSLAKRDAPELGPGSRDADRELLAGS